MCPIQSAPQILARLRLMQPELIVRDNPGRADKPDSRFLLFDKNLPAGELFAKRNLPIRANDLDAGLGSGSFHICGLPLIRRSPATRSFKTVSYYGTNAL